MPKEALFYEKLKNSLVNCHLCPKNCVIKPNEYGNCNARKNISGKLFSMVYSNPCSIAIDPIEKKPLFHFMPGEKAFSVGTAGCNLHCKFCQNWEISQQKPNEISTYEFTPEKLVEETLKSGCKMIAYTYNEPTIFYEYVLETAKLAKKKNLKNVLVSNGFINEEPLKKLLLYIDAANIDLKSFDENFYKDVCEGMLKPILNTLKIMQKTIHLEITNLIIPGSNDNMNNINKMCRWISKNLGNDVPLHFSAFYPCYKMLDKQLTPAETLIKAKKIAEKNKLNFVYIGNLRSEANNTYCPECKKLLIERQFYSVTQNNISNGSCKFCKTKIKGIWV